MRIKIGMYCTFDPVNYSKSNSTEALKVLVLERSKYRPFGNSIWKVRCMTSDSEFECKQKLLEPTGMVGVRFSPDVPSFNDMDIESLDFAICYFDTIMGSNDITNDLSKDTNIKIGNHIKRLKAIREKIKFCKEMREV